MCDRESNHETDGPDRRAFLREAAALGGAAAVAEDLLAAAGPLEMTHIGPDKIPRKPFGKTGVQVSILGVGGCHLGRRRPSRRLCASSTRRSMRASISWTTPGSTTTAGARNGWARR